MERSSHSPVPRPPRRAALRRERRRQPHAPGRRALRQRPERRMVAERQAPCGDLVRRHALDRAPGRHAGRPAASAAAQAPTTPSAPAAWTGSRCPERRAPARRPGGLRSRRPSGENPPLCRSPSISRTSTCASCAATSSASATAGRSRRRSSAARASTTPTGRRRSASAAPSGSSCSSRTSSTACPGSSASIRPARCGTARRWAPPPTSTATPRPSSRASASS